MILIPGRIPIAIHPLFWLLSAMIGWVYSQSLIGTITWMGIIFVSVLVHEFGHALTAIVFKQKAQIQLVALGGLTSFEGPKLKFWKQFLITLNGPLFGFFLFLLTGWILHTLPGLEEVPYVWNVLKITQAANLFWSIVNLLPVLPLDGGQLLRIALEAAFGLKGFRAALLSGALMAALIGFAFFITHAFLAGAIFLLFAYQSFDSWRKTRFATSNDREDEPKILLGLAEQALKNKKYDEAKQLLEMVRDKGGGGMLAASASQYLAELYQKEGKFQEAYHVLLPFKEQLSPEELCLLHKLAAALGEYSLVAELSAICYQALPVREVALANARAFAFLKQSKPAGGWLQTACQHHKIDLDALLKEREFFALKDDPEFNFFILRFKKPCE